MGPSSPDCPSRWFGVGRSGLEDARQAGRAAAAEATEGRSASLLIVFCADTYDLRALVDGIFESAGDVPLIGCSTAGEISATGAGDASVVVTALGGPGFAVATSARSAEDSGLREAAFQAAGCMQDVDEREHRLLMVLSDGLGGDQEEVVRGAYRAVGATVPLVGGCAGDGLKMKATAQLHGRDVLRGSVVAAAITSDGPLGIGVRHGWRRVGEPMLVTDSDGSCLHSLDDQPALDIYLQRLGAPAEAWTDPDAFTHFAMTHPLGLSRRSGEEVRYVAEANFEDRSLVCIAHMAPGGMAWFMEGDEESVLEATDGACRDALDALDGEPLLGLVAFDCVARRGVVGTPGIQREVDRIASFADGAPVAGFYTYGEIARTRGVNGFHNQTLVVLAVA